MSDLVKIAFEQKILTLPISDLLPTKALPAGVRESVKYRRIAASVAEVGLIAAIDRTAKRGRVSAAGWPYAGRCAALPRCD